MEHFTRLKVERLKMLVTVTINSQLSSLNFHEEYTYNYI